MTDTPRYESFWRKVRDTFSGKRAAHWNVVGHPIAFVEGQDNLISLVVRDLLRDGIVLVDFGCGAGKLLVQCARDARNSTLIGVDVSRRMGAEAIKSVQAVGREHGVRVLLLVSPIETCPLPDGFADAAVAKMVLHHVPDPLLALKQMARVVRPGGHVLFMVPGRLYQAEFFPTSSDGQDGLGRFSPDELERFSLAAGLFPQGVYVNRFRFWFDNLYDYFTFMDGIGATSKLAGYEPIAAAAFVEAYKHLLQTTCRFPVMGEYITFDCVKDVTWFKPARLALKLTAH